MKILTRAIVMLLAFAFLAPATGFAKEAKKDKKPSRLEAIKKIKKEKRLIKIKNSEEGKLIEKRLKKTKAVKKLNADKIKKTKKIKDIRAKKKAKLVKMGKKIDRATKIKTQKKKAPGSK